MNIYIFYFSIKHFSDRHETLMAVSSKGAQNPGDTEAVSLDLAVANKIGRIQEGIVEAVTVEDIMEKIPATSYIIKTDIQKYDCKVYVSFMSIDSNPSL